MALGFTVEELIGQARAGGALRMGLVRLDPREWLWPAFDRAARAEAFARNPESFAILPGAAPAAREAARAVAGTDGLREAAAMVWEDLCVLEADSAGAYRLTAGALGFPTDWRLAEKMGQGLLAIHAPIHGYAEQLGGGVDHLFATMPTGVIVGRANSFVVASDAWRYLPEDDPAARFAHVTPANAGATLFVRCERQTLRRLPETGAMLFTIGIAVAPLGALNASTIARIAGMFAALPGDAHGGEFWRRAAPFYAPALGAYAARLGETGDGEAI